MDANQHTPQSFVVFHRDIGVRVFDPAQAAVSYGPVEATDSYGFLHAIALHHWPDGTWVKTTQSRGGLGTIETLTPESAALWMRKHGLPLPPNLAPLLRGDLPLWSPPQPQPRLPRLNGDDPSEGGNQQLELVEGGFVYRGHLTNLSGDALAVLVEFVKSRWGRVAQKHLLETVWAGRQVVNKQVSIVVSDVREALREALRKAGVEGPLDPLPAVDHGKQLAWGLDLPKI